jgi:UDP-2,3-diacylglucosamine hydrolase
MSENPIREFALLAGSGAYPLLLAQEARKQGAERIVAIAFSRETDRAIEKLADSVRWIHVGQIGKMMDALKESGCRQAVMAGRFAPTHLFRVRPDAWAFRILSALPVKNAHTLLGALVNELQAIGIEVLPASTFMRAYMPEAGLLSVRAPTQKEQVDIALGFKVATATSGLEIGQTVVVKDGVILAVEALEGTDQAILRGGKIGGPGVVVVKVAKEGHDMRFDIPVIGTRTMKVIKKVKASVLALQAGKAIILERDQVVRAANTLGVCLLVAECT